MEDIIVHDRPNILFKSTSAREDKIRVPNQSYDVLFITWISTTHSNLRNLSFVYILKAP